MKIRASQLLGAEVHDSLIVSTIKIYTTGGVIKRAYFLDASNHHRCLRTDVEHAIEEYNETGRDFIVDLSL